MQLRVLQRVRGGAHSFSTRVHGPQQYLLIMHVGYRRMGRKAYDSQKTNLNENSEPTGGNSEKSKLRKMVSQTRGIHFSLFPENRSMRLRVLRVVAYVSKMSYTVT